MKKIRLSYPWVTNVSSIYPAQFIFWGGSRQISSAPLFLRTNVLPTAEHMCSSATIWTIRHLRLFSIVIQRSKSVAVAVNIKLQLQNFWHWRRREMGAHHSFKQPSTKRRQDQIEVYFKIVILMFLRKMLYTANLSCRCPEQHSWLTTTYLSFTP